MLFFFLFFFFKQKTAYEMRISDWSSDACSSDLCCQRPAWLYGAEILALWFAVRAAEPGVLRGRLWPARRRAAGADRRDDRHLRAATLAVGGAGVPAARKSDVAGKRVSVRVGLGGRRYSKKIHTSVSMYETDDVVKQ